MGGAVIEASFKLDVPKDVRATLSLTMSIGEWEVVREALAPGTKYPLGLVWSAISSVVNEARSAHTTERKLDP